jgi:hypothetical protein
MQSPMNSDYNAMKAIVNELFDFKTNPEESKKRLLHMQQLEQQACKKMRKELSPEEFSLWKAVAEAAESAQKLLSPLATDKFISSSQYHN